MAQDFFDRVDETLTISAFQDNFRARLSGLIDLEFYQIDEPPVGLIYSDQHSLFNPRLSLFLDAQVGPHVYLFVQSRVDRGFDPSEKAAQVRVDEYAVRVTPWDDVRLDFQAGKFATVIGNWVPRHLSWDNPFVTAPLPYENLTAASDLAAPGSARQFVARYLYADQNLPLIWGPSYATGASVAGKLGEFEYAVEIKNSELASRPESWDTTQIGFDHPAVNGRLGFRPNEMWNFGLSAGHGPYLRPEAAATLPPGRGIGDYCEVLLGQDVSFAWHHLQLWAEFYQTRFEIPRLGDADTFAYFVEAKYKFTPQFFASMRWNQQLYATVSDGTGGNLKWGNDICRIDTALAYRFTAHTQVKVQYSLQDGNARSSELVHILATQFTLRF